PPSTTLFPYTTLFRSDLAAREAAHLEQRAKANFVRPFRQHPKAKLRDDAVLSLQRHNVCQRADRRHLHERGQPVRMAGASAERLDRKSTRLNSSHSQI